MSKERAFWAWAVGHRNYTDNLPHRSARTKIEPDLVLCPTFSRKPKTLTFYPSRMTECLLGYRCAVGRDRLAIVQPPPGV